jgi:hypothetical protein
MIAVAVVIKLVVRPVSEIDQGLYWPNFELASE